MAKKKRIEPTEDELVWLIGQTAEKGVVLDLEFGPSFVALNESSRTSPTWSSCWRGSGGPGRKDWPGPASNPTPNDENPLATTPGGFLLAGDAGCATVGWVMGGVRFHPTSRSWPAGVQARVTTPTHQ